MNITIRNEEPKDYKKVEEITRDAFWNLYCPGCSEHYIVHQIRKHPDFISELTFVIEVDGAVVGSIFYTKSKVVTESGMEHDTITFGPVSITPQLHRQGLGRKLIEHSIEEAKKKGHRAIIILGYPYHYKPYGFLGGKAFGISMGDGQYYTGLQALPLYDDALRDISGQAVFSSVFDEVSTDILDAFDKQFPHKEKRVEESQKAYEIACTELDD